MSFMARFKAISVIFGSVQIHLGDLWAGSGPFRSFMANFKSISAIFGSVQFHLCDLWFGPDPFR